MLLSLKKGFGYLTDLLVCVCVCVCELCYMFVMCVFFFFSLETDVCLSCNEILSFLNGDGCCPC